MFTNCVQHGHLTLLSRCITNLQSQGDSTMLKGAKFFAMYKNQTFNEPHMRWIVLFVGCSPSSKELCDLKSCSNYPLHVYSMASFYLSSHPSPPTCIYTTHWSAHFANVFSCSWSHEPDYIAIIPSHSSCSRVDLGGLWA